MGRGSKKVSTDPTCMNAKIGWNGVTGILKAKNISAHFVLQIRTAFIVWKVLSIV